MEDRINEINFVINKIQKLCIETEIELVAKKVKGQLMIVIQDTSNEKEYYIEEAK